MSWCPATDTHCRERVGSVARHGSVLAVGKLAALAGLKAVIAKARSSTMSREEDVVLGLSTATQ